MASVGHLECRALRLDSTFTVTVAGRSDPRLERALGRTLKRLGRRTGIAFSATIVHGASGSLVVPREVGGAGGAGALPG